MNAVSTDSLRNCPMSCPRLEPVTLRIPISLARRAERAVRVGIVDVSTAEHWLDAFTEVVAADAFVLTLNYYGAVGVKVR